MPEKLMRAMLLQVLYSVRSERQLLEQLRYNLLFCWFVGLAMTRCETTESTAKNRDRLTKSASARESASSTALVGAR